MITSNVLIIMIKNIIDKLKVNLQKETDPMKQALIISEMMKIRGVKEND